LQLEITIQKPENRRATQSKIVNQIKKKTNEESEYYHACGKRGGDPEPEGVAGDGIQLR
jgi:hypothetical protein